MSKLRIAMLAALVALCPVWPSAGASAQAVATLGADTIALGDQTTLRIPLVGDSLVAPTAEGVVLLDHTFDTAGRTFTAVITSFEPGPHWIHVGDDSLLLTVTDVEVDTAATDIRDIAPLQRVPYTFWEIFRWVLLLLGLLAVAALVVWLLTHRQRVQQVLGSAPVADPRTPERRALDALEALRQRQLWQAGKVKEYHTELTDTVRRFIEEATGIRATDMTSDETLDALSSELGVRSPEFGARNSDPTTPTSALKAVFATADMVKFAKSTPLPHEHEASMSRAVDFVRQVWALVKPAEKEAEHE